MNTRLISVVTGANGFVGSHLVDLLLEKGHEVHCIVRQSSNLRWLKDKPVKIYDCGLYDKDSLKPILKDADYLFHVAGVVKAKDKEGYYRGNVDPTRILLEVLTEVNTGIKKVVIVSSQTAAGPSIDGVPVNEKAVPNPITTYGRSKLAQEETARSFMDRLPINIVRAVAVYGPRDTEIYLVFKTYQKGLMTIIGFNKKELSLIHVKDLVDGLYLAGISDTKGQVYFIGSEEYYNWPQVGEVFAKAIGKKALTIRLPHSLVYTVAAVAQFFAMFSRQAATFNIEKARDFVQAAWTCDVSKAKNELGFRQNMSIDEGIKTTVDWYREKGWL